jgi:uncharacterized protein involved in response to NO
LSSRAGIAAAILLIGVVGGRIIPSFTTNWLMRARWAGDRTLAEPLVTVLHVAFAFVPAGFLLSGYALLADDVGARSAGIHAWTAGAVGMMTLAVMTRATRGHSGRPLTAPLSTVLIYVAVFLAVLLRIAAAFLPEQSVALLALAGTAWVLAFGGFAVAYGAMLLLPRP